MNVPRHYATIRCSAVLSKLRRPGFPHTLDSYQSGVGTCIRFPKECVIPFCEPTTYVVVSETVITRGGTTSEVRK